VKQGRQMLNSLMADSSRAAKPVPDTPIILGSAKGQELIDIQNLWFSYPDKEEVIKNVNLLIREGDFIALLGENGAGKTTLLKNINGLLKPSRGK
jgi:ABC-type bacteriocin/lantibiotic exporter with double-glycine peptidase domain